MIRSFSLLFFLLIFSTQILVGQNFKGTKSFDFHNSTALNEQFKNFEVFELDAKSIDGHFLASKETIDFNLTFSKRLNWNFEMVPNNIKGPNYAIKISSELGEYSIASPKVITFKGHDVNGAKARFTINDDFFYGLIEDGDSTYFIEPLHYFEPEADKNLFVIYEFDEVVKLEGKTCGAHDFVNKKKEIDNQISIPDEDLEGKLVCYDVDVRLAADWSMNTKHGGITPTENHIIGVLNNVATNYDDEFANELILIVGSTFISTCSTCDPWTTSTNASTLLNSFTSWGQGNGFGTTDFEVATLWTDRNLNGSTIGIAWVGAVCTNSKYNVCQDFTSNAANLRVLQAHEIGHNFDANHDAGGSPFIMAPSVNTSTIWSTASILSLIHI